MRKFLIMVLVLIPSLSAAQEMVTDRPDQTESSSLVQQGRVQIESGVLFERDRNTGKETFLIPSTLFRAGVLPNFELRLLLEYTKEKTDVLLSIYPPQVISQKASGLAPVTIGAKIGIAEEENLLPEIALLTHVTLPKTGTEEFQTEYFAPEIRFSFSHTLNDDFSLGYNLGGVWDGNSANVTGIYTLALGYSFMNYFGAFIEVFGDLPQGSSPEHFADGGFTYSPVENLQFDISGGLGLAGSSKEYFLSTGVSVRLPR